VECGFDGLTWRWLVFEFIARLFRTDPGSKIRKERDRKYKEAVQLQRDGKLREYAKIMKEIKALEDEYIEVTSASG
jgi:hypothetical protein|tara:strand:- start:69 stop:296 length:228 start_codon:yes stop_codon:yes gene_type:complete